MSRPSEILRLDRATVDADAHHDSPLWNADLSLGPGELALVRLDSEQPLTPLADAAVGLASPVAGSVRFLGVDWAHRSDQDAAAARGRIGRVFESAAWISNLNLADNITLAALHHGDRDLRSIYDEAAEWARTFDLPGLPTGRVSRALASDLRRAECIRAFLGDPSLIILERPERGVLDELMPALINACRAARARGAAVLWTTTSDDVFTSRALRPDHRVKAFGARLRPVIEPPESPPCANPPLVPHSTAPSAPSSSSEPSD